MKQSSLMQLMSACCLAGLLVASDATLAQADKVADKKTNEEVVVPKVAAEAAPNRTMLPLAGVTADQATQALQALAEKNKLPLDPKALAETIKFLSSDKIDCARLGLLCGLVGKERVPGIIRAAWAVQARGGDFNETLAAFDKAVSSAAQQNAQAALRAGDSLESDLNQAIQDNKIDPKDQKQVQEFIISRAPGGAKSMLSWNPSLGLGAGARTSCDFTQKWSYTPQYHPLKWKWRMLAGCGGDLWGEVTVDLGWKNFTFTGGFITVASLSFYMRSPCYCVPMSPDTMTTTNEFKSHSASATTTSSWIVAKTAAYGYVPPKSGTYSGSSNEANIVALSYSDQLPF